MGWKGQLRSFNAAMNRAEKHRKRVQRQQAAANAFNAVQEFERYVEEIVSYHKTANCSPIDWKSFKDAVEPTQPVRSHQLENEASSYLESYQPGFLIRLLRLVNFRINWLKNRIEKAKTRDERQFKQSFESYKDAHSKWKTQKEAAEKMLSGDVDAYVRLIADKKPFSSIQHFSGKINLSFQPGTVSIAVELDLGENVPSETATYLKSGSISVKDTPKTKYHQLCQEHVCSIALRVAREILALIPVEFVLVQVMTDVLDSSMGALEMKPILSLKVPRSSIQKINFENVSPSDCMKNFVHNIDFKKLEGLGPVSTVA